MQPTSTLKKQPNMVVNIAPHMWVGPTSVAASTFPPFKAVANTATLKETHKVLKDPHEVNHAAEHSNDYRDITEAWFQRDPARGPDPSSSVFLAI